METIAARSRRIEIGSERRGIAAFDEGLRGDDVVEVRLVETRAGRRYVGRHAYFPYASCRERTVERIQAECADWLDASDELLTWRDDGPVQAPLKVRWLERLAFAWRELLRVAWFALRYCFEDVRWDVGIARSTPEAFIERPSRTSFHWLVRDGKKAYRGGSFADPMFAAVDGRPYVLCERIGGDRIGTLAGIDLDRFDGSHRTIFADGMHASYPFVFPYQGEEYVIPERAASGRVDLFKLTRGGSPTRDERGLEFVATLIPDFPALDATVLHYRGRWWLFATDASNAANSALHLFHANDLRGPWNAHPANPVKIDVRSARPAGRPFVAGGRLFRPAQDCSGRYGRAIAINEIIQLDRRGFSERTVATVDAPAITAGRRSSGMYGAAGVHTLSHRDGWIAIDAQFVRWSLLKPFRLLRARMHTARIPARQAPEKRVPGYAA